MLNPFFQPLYSTVLNEKSNNLLPTFSRRPGINYYTLYSTQEMGIYYCVTLRRKVRIRCSQLLCIEVNVPCTNFSIKQLRGNNALQKNRTRSNLTQSVFDTTEPGVVYLHHLSGVDRQEGACPPVAYISDLIRVSSHAFQLR